MSIGSENMSVPSSCTHAAQSDALCRQSEAKPVIAPKPESTATKSSYGAQQQLKRLIAQAPPPAPTPKQVNPREKLLNTVKWDVSRHLKTSFHYALGNLDPAIKGPIVKAYTKDGEFNETKFLADLALTVRKHLVKLDWDDILDNDSEADNSDFTLEDVNSKLEDVGKDIIIGAVFVESSEAKLTNVLTNTKIFPRYGATFGVGILKASDCAPDHVMIQFGFNSPSVTVVNQNRNHLTKKGVQYWRLASQSPKGCPPIQNIGVNIGVQSIFPYKDSKLNGHVVTYFLMATPGTQVLAGRAMDNTLDGIEKLSEEK